MLRVSCFIGLLAALQGNAQFVRSLDGCINQVTDHLVAVGGDSDLLAAAHQLANHPRAGEGFARARRALNRQNATGKMRAEPNCGVNGRLVHTMQQLASDARPRPAQEIARRLIRPVTSDAMIGDMFADPY